MYWDDYPHILERLSSLLYAGFSLTRPSAPGQSSSRDVRCYVECCPLPMQFIVRSLNSPEIT